MTAKYAFIESVELDLPRRYGLKNMCRWAGVSASGFFHWRTRPASAQARRHAQLGALVAWSFQRSRGTYGYRRVHADLMRRGVTVGADLVRDLMRELDLVACQPRPFRVTTIAGADGGTPDLLQRNFTATAPGHKLVGDITYIHTWAGFGYLATVIDCYSKAVIGWAVADHMRTDLVIDALAMARRNHTTEPDCIFHSDRGHPPAGPQTNSRPTPTSARRAGSRSDGRDAAPITPCCQHGRTELQLLPASGTSARADGLAIGRLEPASVGPARPRLAVDQDLDAPTSGRDVRPAGCR